MDFRARGAQGALPGARSRCLGDVATESKPRAPRVQKAAERKSGISMAILEFWAAMLGIIRVVELYDEANGARGIERPLLVRAVPVGSSVVDRDLALSYLMFVRRWGTVWQRTTSKFSTRFYQSDPSLKYGCE